MIFPLVDRVFGRSGRSVEKADSLPIQDSQSPWEQIDCFSDRRNRLPTHRFLPKQRHVHPEIKAAFKTDEPAPAFFLLHHGKDWKKNAGQIPVLLIHGIGTNATQTFDRLAPALRSAGHPVFGFTVPHNQWSAASWCHQLGNAIGEVKNLTDSKAVNLIGHSFGGIVSSMYVSQLRESWMKPYQDGEVKILVTLGSPRGGLDILFRLPKFNMCFFDHHDPEANYPMTWTAVHSDDRGRVETGRLSIVGGYYPAMCQITHPWDVEDPVRGRMERLNYYGTNPGDRVGFEASGIYEAMASGGNFIHSLKRHPVPDSVKLHLIGGTGALPDVPDVHRIPNDGYVPLNSAIFYHSDERVDRKILPLNHRQLVDDEAAVKAILEALS